MRAVPIGAGRWAITEAHYSPALVAAARLVPGMAFDRERKVWVGYHDAVALTFSHLAARGLRVTPPPAEEVGDLITPLAEKDRRGYQLEGARFLLSRKRAILGDVMRLGKTCTAITAARALNSRTLVVCPSYVRGVWRDELQRWWKGVAVVEMKGTTPGDVGDDRVVLCHYDILHAQADMLAEWGPRVVIFDEAHVMQNESSQRAKAAALVSANAECAWGLTGTPLTNRPRDLFALASIIRPGVFGDTFFRFGERHCGGYKKEIPTHPPKVVWDFSGKSNLLELRERLKGWMLRRTIADVGLALPQKIRQSIWVDVPARQQVIPKRDPASIRAALDKTADVKIPAAIELVKAHVAEGHRVVVFTHRRSVAEHIGDAVRFAKGKAEVVHGGVSHVRRENAVLRGRGWKRGGAFVATIDAASMGIDLSFADVVVFAELTWEPHKLLQAEARPMKVGGAPVLVQYVLGRGGIDELIAHTVVSKLDTFAAAIGGAEDLSVLQGVEEDVMKDLYAAIEKGKHL